MRITSQGFLPAVIAGLLAASVGIASGSTAWMQTLLPEVLAAQDADPVVPPPAPMPDGLVAPDEEAQDGQAEPAWKTKVNVDGYLTGELSELTPDYITVQEPILAAAALISGGTVVDAVKAGPGGAFQIPVGETSGPAAFSAAGPTGFATYGIDLSANQDEAVGRTVLSTILASPLDLDFVEMKAEMVPMEGYPAGGNLIDPEAFVTRTRPNEGAVLELDPRGDLTSLICIPSGGEVRAANGMDVWFLRFGEVLGTGRTDETGSFHVTGLEPGYYSFVAAGEYGMIVCGVEIVPSSEEADGVAAMLGLSGSLQNVAFAAGNGTYFVPTAPGDLPAALQSLAAAGGGLGTPPPTQFPGGGGPGGGGGGAGGGGGDWLLPALIGAGIGAAIAAAADDDDGGGGPVSPHHP